MARMSREFSLVLVGASLLTAGYFYLHQDDPVGDRFDEETHGHSTRHGSHVMFLGLPMGGSHPSRGTTTTARGVSRGGFGSIGSHTAGG